MLDRLTVKFCAHKSYRLDWIGIICGWRDELDGTATQLVQNSNLADRGLLSPQYRFFTSARKVTFKERIYTFRRGGQLNSLIKAAWLSGAGLLLKVYARLGFSTLSARGSTLDVRI